MNIKINKEFKNLIPELSKEEYNLLEKSILSEGCRDSLILWGDILIDGHNRYEICQRNNVEFSTKEISFTDRDEVKIWIIKNQFGRRNLDTLSRIELALLLKSFIKEKAKENLSLSGGDKKSKEYKSGCLKSDNPIDDLDMFLSSEEHNQFCLENTHDLTVKKEIIPVDTNKELAGLAGVSRDTFIKGEKVLKEANPEVIQAIKEKRQSINKVYTELKQEERKTEIEQQKKDIATGKTKLPEGVFEVIAIDPPWPYETEYNPNGRRAANPYPEMSLEEIKNIQIPSSENSILWLWTTHKFMRNSFEILDKWGFRDVAILTWVKDRMGLGSWLRSQSEYCIMAVKGNPKVNLTNETTVLNAPMREHSRKPDEFYSMVNNLCIGRKLEYFSREKREGWEVYGNDTEKF